MPRRKRHQYRELALRRWRRKHSPVVVEASEVIDPDVETSTEAAENEAGEEDGGASSEYTSDSDSDDEPTPKRREDDPEFHLTTPQRRKIAEIPGVSNGAYMGQTAKVHSFVENINAIMSCTTPSCKGKLKPVDVKLVGLGGAACYEYHCSGCTNRVAFDSSDQLETGQTAIGQALQVAFIAAGCTYAVYRKVLANFFGIHTVGKKQFMDTLARMDPHVKSIVDEQCSLAKTMMQEKPTTEFGSFQNAVTTADGAWLTRGYHSQNFTYQVRDYLTGALLYYKHLCQRGREGEEVHPGTSKSAEGTATDHVIAQAKQEGMNIAVHWMDKGSSSASAIRKHFPDAELMLCGGHATRAHEKALKIIQGKRCFTNDEKIKHREKYPDVDTAQCHCTRHKDGCGCMTNMFIASARGKFFRAMVDAKNDPEKFVERLEQLSHHSHNEHEWNGGNCDFHPMKVCSCGECDDNFNLQCVGKHYKSRYTLTCPYHALAYQIQLDKRAPQSTEIIHSVLGRGHTNQIEAAHNVLIRFRAKHLHLTRLHYIVSTNLGLLQSNMTFMNKVRGLNYHWILDLIQRMGLPLFQGVEAVLKQVNVERSKNLEYIKTDVAKKKRIQWKSHHRGREQDGRKQWVQAQKIHHTYGSEVTQPSDASLVSTPSRSSRKRVKTCKCGSTTHSRTSHRECPLNKHRGLMGKPTNEPEAEQNDSECSNTESECDVGSEEHFGFSSSDEAQMQFCMCESRAHSRACPLNPRNRGAHTITFSPGNYVCLHVMSLDNLHVLCRVAEVVNKRYRLCCFEGVLLDKCYTSRELTPLESNCTIDLSQWRLAKRCNITQVCKNPQNIGKYSCDIISCADDVIELSASPTPPQEYWVQNPLYCLSVNAKERLEMPTGWLDDSVVNAAQNVLKCCFPNVFGLESTLKQESLSFTVHEDDRFVQILNIRNRHWCTVTNIGCECGVVKVFDSMYRPLPTETISIIARLVFCTAPELTIQIMNVSQQTNGADCGVLSIAYAYDLCTELDPCNVVYDHTSTRNHLSRCLEQCSFSRFPILHGKQVKKFVKSTIKIELHCLCRLPEGGEHVEFVQCNICERWFHPHCLDIPKSVIDNEDEPWNCTLCTPA